MATSAESVAVQSVAVQPRAFRVAHRRRELADTVTLDLEPTDGGPPLLARPGQFTMLAAFGHNEVPISVSGSSPTAPLQHTVRAVGLSTNAIVRSRVGDRLWVRGAFGRGWCAPPTPEGDVVVVAGGLGLAPLRPLLRDLIATGSHRRVSLLVGARTPEDVLFAQEVSDWRLAIDVHLTVDAAPRGWRGSVGLVTSLLPRARFDPATSTAYVCGPEIMMRATARALTDRGVPDERILLSLERNMRCGVGLCGHCQLRGLFLCTDGPVLTFRAAAPLMAIREL